jgi:diguanylate cyclase (GGDEF)-like protein/PAS domain S-box-containing protein
MTLLESVQAAAKAPLIQLSTDFIRAKEYLEAIVTSTTDAICTTDVAGRIMYFSPGAESMTGHTSAQMMGRWAHEIYAEGRVEAERVMKLMRRDGRLQNHETAIKTRDGRTVHVSMSAALLRDRAGRVIGTLGISKDITERVELERRLRELSITDNLTGLYNQRHFHDRLAQEVSRARRQRQKLSLILIDLDHFKSVNDRMGHLAGDRLLREFGAALQSGIRRHIDTAYRYGGDEFVVLLPGQSAPRAAQVAARLAKEGLKTLAPCGAGLSYGVASLPKSGSTEEFVKSADKGMYAMKAKGRQARKAGSRA